MFKVIRELFLIECKVIIGILLATAGPPYWITKPSNISAKLNENIELVCDAGGSPIPKITWSWTNAKGEKTIIYMYYTIIIIIWFINSFKGEQLMSSSKSLNIHTSLKEDGFYTCKADNGVGSLEEKILLTINGNSLLFKY